MSCERDDISDQSMGDNNKDSDTILSIRNLNTKDIKEKVELNEEIEKINVNREDKFTARSTNSDSTDTAPIKAEHAIEIISGKNKTYTFQLAPKQGTEDNPALHNIVFIKQDDGSFRTLGITYDFTEEQAETFDKTGQLDGEIHVLFFEIHNLKDQPQLSARSNDAPCANIEGGMDCGSLDEVVITTGGGGSGGGGGGGTSGPGDSPGHNLLKLAPGGGGGGGYTAPVDDDEVIIDPSFEDNECLNGVYEALKDGNHTISDYIDNFIPDNSVANLTLNTDDDFKSTHDPSDHKASAYTEEPVGYNINIVFNTDKNLDASLTNDSSILIALKFTHEIIHAEMYRKLLSEAGKHYIPWTKDFIESIRNDFPGLSDYYARYEFGDGEEVGVSQHEQMAQHYRETIVDVLKKIDNTNHQDSFYEAIAWKGLKSTVAWEELSSREKLSINEKLNNARNENSCMD